jgi:hypothetical protein
MKLLETSAKTNTNVAEAFTIMAKEIITLTMEKENNIKKDNEKKEKISLKPKGGKEIKEKNSK